MLAASLQWLLAPATARQRSCLQLCKVKQSQATWFVGMWLSMTMWAWVHKASVGLMSSGGTALAACWPGGMLHLLTKTHTQGVDDDGRVHNADCTKILLTSKCMGETANASKQQNAPTTKRHSPRHQKELPSFRLMLLDCCHMR